MAQFTYTDFQIYDPYFQNGATEVLRQQVNAFNGASGNTIQLRNRMLEGDYSKEATFSLVNDLIQERDPTSAGVVPDTELTQFESVSVKLNRRLGPMKGTLDSWKKIASDPRQFSQIIGRQSGEAMAQDFLESIISAISASLNSIAAVTEDGSAGTMSHAALVAGLARRGDRANEISNIVMHSKPYFDLVQRQITDNVLDVAGVAIHTATPVTLGKNVIVTDSASLIDTTGANPVYSTLLLAPGAGVVEESEGRSMVLDSVTGEQNLAQRLQGEHAYNIGVKGCTWNVGAGGASPNRAAVALGTNWTQVVSDVKDLAGVVVKTL